MGQRALHFVVSSMCTQRISGNLSMQIFIGVVFDKYGLAKRYMSYIQKVKETIRKTAKKSFYKEYKKCD